MRFLDPVSAQAKMLSEFSVKKFRSYEEATLKVGPLTVLIGANASGKSNAIEGLRFLSWLGKGNNLGLAPYALAKEGSGVRGKVKDLAYRNSNSFSLSCRTTHPEWNHYSIQITKLGDEQLHITDERLTAPWAIVPLFEIVQCQSRGGDVRVAYNNFARGGKKPQVRCTDQTAVLVQLQGSARFEKGHRKTQATIPEVTREYQRFLSRIVFLDPQPKAMRGYADKHSRIERNGGNFSGTLFNLCMNDNKKDQVMRFIRGLPENDVGDISFIETPRNEVMVRLAETFGGQTTEYDATLLSDGTLRVLAIAAAVLSARKGSLVVVEEVDNGVHPSRAKRLLKQLATVADRRGLRILASSHNPGLLDALPEAAIPNVVYCYRDSESGSSRLQRLEDIPEYPELIAQGMVGHLMTNGIIERFVKNRPGIETKRERSLSWLSEIRQRAR